MFPLHAKKWSNQIMIVHMSWQQSCHDLWQFVTWLDNQNGKYIKKRIVRFKLWTPKVFMSWVSHITSLWGSHYIYGQVSNIRRTLVSNKIVDHTDVVGASPVGAAPTTSSFSTWTPGFIGLGKDNCKARRETLKFRDLVCLILEILW